MKDARRQPAGASPYDSQPLHAFVSSAIVGMEAERAAAEAGIDALAPIVRAWLFEHSGASSAEGESFYLDKASECDIFVLLIDSADREAVRREYARARESGRPILAFVSKRPDRPAGTTQFIRSITAKRASYRDVAHLHQRVIQAIANEIIDRYRARLTPVQKIDLARKLEPPTPTDIRDVLDQWTIVIRQPSILTRIFRPARGRPAGPDMKELLRLFGGRIPPLYAAPRDGFERLTFHDLDEFQDTWNGLRSIVDQVTAARGRPRKALQEGLTREVGMRVRRYARAASEGRSALPPAGLPAPFQQVSAMSLDIRDEWAGIVKLLRAPGSAVPSGRRPSGVQIGFSDVRIFRDMGSLIDRAARERPDNFMAALAELAAEWHATHAIADAFGPSPD